MNIQGERSKKVFPLTDNLLDHTQDVGWRKRLFDPAVEAQGFYRVVELGGSAAGHQQNLCVRGDSPDGLRQLQTVHVTHAPIGQYQIKSLLHQPPHCRETIWRCHNLIIGFSCCQNTFEQEADAFLVINNEDTFMAVRVQSLFSFLAAKQPATDVKFNRQTFTVRGLMDERSG